MTPPKSTPNTNGRPATPSGGVGDYFTKLKEQQKSEQAARLQQQKERRQKEQFAFQGRPKPYRHELIIGNGPSLPEPFPAPRDGPFPGFIPGIEPFPAPSPAVRRPFVPCGHCMKNGGGRAVKHTIEHCFFQKPCDHCGDMGHWAERCLVEHPDQLARFLKGKHEREHKRWARRVEAYRRTKAEKAGGAS